MFPVVHIWPANIVLMSHCRQSVNSIQFIMKRCNNI